MILKPNNFCKLSKDTNEIAKQTRKGKKKRYFNFKRCLSVALRIPPPWLNMCIEKKLLYRRTGNKA